MPGSCSDGCLTCTISGSGSSFSWLSRSSTLNSFCFFATSHALCCSSISNAICCSYMGRSSHRVVSDFSRWRPLNASSEPAIISSMRCALAGSLLIGLGCLRRGCTSSCEQLCATAAMLLRLLRARRRMPGRNTANNKRGRGRDELAGTSKTIKQEAGPTPRNHVGQRLSLSAAHGDLPMPWAPAGHAWLAR